MARFVSSGLPTGDVLDLGCGSGILTCFYAIARPDASVVGADLSATGLAVGSGDG